MTLNLPAHESTAPRPRRAGGLTTLGAVIAASVLAPGCYRATGLQRGTVTAQQVPEVGGDRVPGLKAEAAPGDFFLGNDYLNLAVDGTRFGSALPAVAGAPAGGSIIDIGPVVLDQSYKRVAVPVDALERLTPVVNQDPDITLVFDHYEPSSDTRGARIDMRGHVHDPQHRLGGASWDSQGRVVGIEVLHSISLGKDDSFFLLETTVRNTGASAVGLRNVGDLLIQRTAGFRFNVPAAEDAAGNLLTGWGVEIPGTAFGDPAAAVKAPMVAFMGVEPSGSVEDGHCSLGLLPVDGDDLLVSSDPQTALAELRPRGASKLVAGGPAGTALASGASLTHRRRLYVAGGNSLSGNLPNQATGVLGQMAKDRVDLRGFKAGVLLLQSSGSATRQGPYPAELRVERQTAGGWRHERTEWLEPAENAPNGSLGQSSNPTLALLLPEGTYRVSVRNAPYGQRTFTELANRLNEDRPTLPGPIVIEDGKVFSNAGMEVLAPERDQIIGPSGGVVDAKVQLHGFVVRGVGKPAGDLQPGRVTLLGLGGTPDPGIKRIRGLGSSFSAVTKAPAPTSSNYAVYAFSGGNELFAASMSGRSYPTFWLPMGDYEACLTRGPLAHLETLGVRASLAQTIFLREFLALPAALPEGWTTFDLPGPSLGTTGGHLPVEKLASALAEGIRVVGVTDTDRHPDAEGLRTDFRAEFLVPDLTDEMRSDIGEGPWVVAGRSSSLAQHGTATSLFVPAPVPLRNGGARNAKGWTLADFLAQAQGAFTVVHRPRGPEGLFTRQGFDPAVALGSGANAWWNATAPFSGSLTQGQFDALELLRGEGCDPVDPTAWFEEFKLVRADWLAILRQQTPAAFTKALGLSAAHFTLDTPVGLARTYLKATGFSQEDTSAVLQALKTGAAVASTGPFLGVQVGNGTATAGPGGSVPAVSGSVSVTVTLMASDWVPVDEVRLVVNGAVVQTLNPATFTVSATDARVRTATVALPVGTTQDAVLVVEAGVPLTQAGAYLAGSYWNRLMRGIYPIAVANPVFIDANGGGYTPPGL